jgi:LDH2 family malate/lactate/ureidoglycolate dehydrogenase
MLRQLRTAPPAEGAERVYYAGLKEFEAEQESARRGVALLRKTYDQLVRIGREQGITPPPAVGERD